MYGEDYAPPEAVAQTTVIFFIAESGLYQEVFLETLLNCFLGEGITFVGAVSQLEFLDDVIPEPAAPEIGHAYPLPFHVIVKYVLEIFGCKLVDNKQTFTQAMRLFLFISQFTFLYLDIVFPGKPFQRFVIGELFMFHDEMHHIASLAATEAFT